MCERVANALRANPSSEDDFQRLWALQQTASRPYECKGLSRRGAVRQPQHSGPHLRSPFRRGARSSQNGTAVSALVEETSLRKSWVCLRHDFSCRFHVEEMAVLYWWPFLVLSDCIWRRERDSNPRRAFDPYTLSRGAPSTTRPSLRSGENCRVIRCLRARASAPRRAGWP